MKMTKKITALLLALVMALSLSTMAFADGTVNTEYEQPTSSEATEDIGSLTSVTVNGAEAAFYYDDNTGTDSGDPVYIRATVSGTEYNLQTATVVITTANKTPTVSLNGTTIAAASSTGSAYTYNLDLLNKAYTVSVDGKTFTLAAGLAKTTNPIAVPTADPMRISAMTIGGATGDIKMSVVQNPYMGNPYYTMWTSVTYTVKATMAGKPVRSNLSGSITIPNGTSAPSAADTCLKGTITGTGSAQTCALDLTSNTTLRVVYGNYSRNYTVIATDENTISVSFGFDFTEAINSTEYKSHKILKDNITVTDAVDQLIVNAHAYFAKTNEDATATYGIITVTAGSTVMDIMRNFAVANQLGSEVPEGCTYMATLNGIGEFTFGQYSGWMYTDGPNWDNKATNAKFYESWNTPPIGAASYTLSEGDEICWFICCNYMHHPW